ncbi:hypothetical protein A6R68_03931 [Neotoma lepida]|uniref:ubiquitinyl hydrolase 1 n=1 Tax=Neotoma lepida TaxID=56216 RepID=A0A1A6GMK9_NEOLE|nr:hypothetical protein A6R68_03931 [Neotoma lepida]
MDPGVGAARSPAPPPPRFLLALGSRSRSGDSPPRPRPQGQPGPYDGDGDGGFACAPGPAPVAPGSPGPDRPPGPQPQLSAGDGARPPGAQGLKNHGNTCFMNAVVQCLSNTDLLAEFLALGRYRAVPGRAEVTEQLAALVRALWTREYTPQLSAEFKNAVSKYGSQFQGNSQHDALEFLLWLLDRVHEDLEGSAHGLVSEQLPPDASKALEDLRPPAVPPSLGPSFVQSHFQAQYSNTFDPFLCVSLPIPLRQTRPNPLRSSLGDLALFCHLLEGDPTSKLCLTLSLTPRSVVLVTISVSPLRILGPFLFFRFLSVTLVFPSKTQRFLRVGLAVPILSTVAALRKMVAEEGGVPAEERSFFDEEDLNTIAEGDNVYAFQVPPSSGPGTLSAHPSGLSVSPRLAVRDSQRFTKPLHSERVLILFCNLVGSGQQASRFGPPFLIREDRTISWAQLQQCILSKVRCLMRSEVPAQDLGTLFSIRVGFAPQEARRPSSCQAGCGVG